jgi:large subunit ribosomal protein L19
MNTSLITQVEKEYLKTDLPEISAGDTVEVSTIIREGDKQRIQKFKGLVIATKGSGTRSMITVRKISFGVGVEKMFPIHSTNVAGVKIIKTGNVRKSKLYYMRKREGRRALKVREGAPVVFEENAPTETPVAVEAAETIA